MTLPLIAQSPPLRLDDNGVIRVGKTRVPVETVVYTFNRGATAEEIVQQCPALALSDVYLVIGYYLQNRAEVDAYIQEQRQEAEQIRQKNEARFDPA
ncbi:MAG: DUF433 domain-containing protein [Chloroflexi bacterium]|nr:DUF433 domain-containing protein [Chloroflexota bacterium]